MTKRMAEENCRAPLGTALLLNLVKRFGALPPVAKEYRERLVLKIELFVADKAAVKTTKFKIPAAPAMPIALKTWTKGLEEVTMWFHG